MRKQNRQGCSTRRCISHTIYFVTQSAGKVNGKKSFCDNEKKHKLENVNCVGTNSANGSQPLSPKTALIFWEKFWPFSNFPLTKQVAQYSDWAAPILNPPIPSFTVKIKFEPSELTLVSKRLQPE